MHFRNANFYRIYSVIFLDPKKSTSFFFGCPLVIKSQKRGWGEPSSLKVFHCLTGNSTVFRVFLRSCRKELGYQESCPEDGSEKNRRAPSTKIGGHPQQKASQVFFCLEILQSISLIHPDQMGKRMFFSKNTGFK